MYGFSKLCLCQFHHWRNIAVVDEGEILICAADAEREEGEAGGHVEVGDGACAVDVPLLTKVVSTAITSELV
jgi:hypothetical protein